MMLLLLLACVGSSTRSPSGEASAPAVALSEGELILLHTNDLHGHYLPERANWLEGEPEIGGFEALDAYVQAQRQSYGEGRVMLLDGGDILSGTPLSDKVVRGSQGGAMLDFMEAVGFDAWVLGNHEFDKGFDNIQAFVKSSRMPVLSANLRSPEGEGFALENQLPSVVIEKAGLRVGVIGATTEGLDYLTSKETMEHIVIQDTAAAVRAQIEVLDPQTDLIVVLTHIGLDSDKELADRVDGIDLIVGGHSHTHLDEPVQVNGAWIVQAGSYTRSVGKLRMVVRDDAIVRFDGQLVDLTPEVVSGTASAEVKALVAQYDGEIKAVFDVPIGAATSTLGRSYHTQSDLGMWATDMLKDATGADIAVYNSGGLRADLVAGPLTRRSMYNIFPFGNPAVTFTVTGTEVTALMLSNAMSETFKERGAMQVSGAEIDFRIRMEVPEAVQVTVGGQPIDPSGTYTVASNSYVVEQADRYLAGAKPKDVKETGRTVFELACEAAEQGTIDKPTNKRVRRTE